MIFVTQTVEFIQTLLEAVERLLEGGEVWPGAVFSRCLPASCEWVTLPVDHSAQHQQVEYKESLPHGILFALPEQADLSGTRATSPNQIDGVLKDLVALVDEEPRFGFHLDIWFDPDAIV